MARKELPLKGAGNDAVDYRAFFHAMLTGDIKATTLRESTRVSGQVRRLTKLEYDEPTEQVAQGETSKQT